MDIPIPRYAIGDTVWTAGIETESAKFPCPDCLGTGKWEITTPAGTKAEMSCLRCGSWSSTDLPDLTYVTASPVVREHRISGVTIDLKDGVEYRTGTATLRESGAYSAPIYASKESAMAAARILAVAKNAAIQATPQVMEKKNFSLSTLTDARFNQFKNHIWTSFYRYRRLRENLTEMLGETPELNAKGWREAISEAVAWEDHPIHTSATPIEKLVKAVERLIADPQPAPGSDVQVELIEAVALAYAEIPVFTRRVLLGEKPTEKEFLDGQAQE